jgi:hypothetical protein
MAYHSHNKWYNKGLHKIPLQAEEVVGAVEVVSTFVEYIVL